MAVTFVERPQQRKPEEDLLAPEDEGE